MINKLTKTLSIIVFLAILFLVTPKNAFAQQFKQTGSGYDIFEGNNPRISSGWVDPVTGTLGDRIQGAATLWNTAANTIAQFSKIRLVIPNDVSTSHVVQVIIWADNASQVTDTLTINTDVQTQLSYAVGHASVFMPGCPNGCPLNDSALIGSGVTVGGISSGSTNSAQVTFKIDIIPVPTATPTATPTPTETPIPTPTPTPVPSSPTSSCQNLTASTLSGTACLAVSFTGSGTDSAGSIQQYQFNFGDSSNGQDQIVTTNNNTATHNYCNTGNFTANLIVKDSRGVWVGGGNCQVNINVSSKPTVLGATAPPVLPKTGNDAGIFVAVAAIPSIIGGIYLYRRFKLL